MEEVLNTAGDDNSPLLKVEKLSAGFDVEGRLLQAVDEVSFSVYERKTLGIVGESGCGKSVTAHSIMQLLPRPAGQILSGKILFRGKDLLEGSESDMHAIRGKDIGMVFQEPLAALNPVRRVGDQIAEVLHFHGYRDKEERRQKVLAMMQRVGIPAAEQRMREYPHQLSGGMRQRIVIAMALICQPSLLIADEPTTALDVTTQAQILELLSELKSSFSMSMILITHDLGVIANNCDEVAVMYAGRIVEMAPVKRIFEKPMHRYTEGLLRSMPRIDSIPKTTLPTIPGRVPTLDEMPVGARFAPRSDHPRIETYLKSESYHNERPRLIEIEPDHWVEDCEFVQTNVG